MGKTLAEILECFWKWLKMTPEIYVTESMRQPDLEEYMFPLWDEMYNRAVDLIESDTENKTEIDSILTAMALDNETENILDYIAENGSDSFISRIVEAGKTHIQPNARWQCAELIRRRKPKNSMDVLHCLLADSDEYVVKRAKNALLYPYEVNWS